MEDAHYHIYYGMEEVSCHSEHVLDLVAMPKTLQIKILFAKLVEIDNYAPQSNFH